MRRCLNCMEEYPDSAGDRCPYCGYVEGSTQNGGNCLSAGTILQARYIVGTSCSVRDIDITYRAWDALFDRKICIQEYFPSQLASRSGRTQITIMNSRQDQYQEGLRLFCRDSRELIRLYKEEDIITYHACFLENGTAYAVIDYREDPTLEYWLGQQSIDRNTVKLLSDRAHDAIDKCHKIGVSHGRITAKSFYITANGLILKDFGAWGSVCTPEGKKNSEDSPEETDSRAVSTLYYQMLIGKEDPVKRKAGLPAGVGNDFCESAEYDDDDKVTVELPYIPTSKRERRKKKRKEGFLEKKLFFEVPLVGIIAGGAVVLIALILIVFSTLRLAPIFGEEGTENTLVTETSAILQEELQSSASVEAAELEMSVSSEVDEPETAEDPTNAAVQETTEGSDTSTAQRTTDTETTAVQETMAMETIAARETTAEETTAAQETTAVETTMAQETAAAPTIDIFPETAAPTAATSADFEPLELQLLTPVDSAS